MFIKDYLSDGESAAIHLTDLCRITGSSASAIKAAVRRERLAGTPILSSQSGYWLADSECERRGFLRSMEMQATSRFEVAEAVKRADLGV